MHILAGILMFVIASIVAACDGDFSGLEAIGKFVGGVVLFFVMIWLFTQPAFYIIVIIIVVALIAWRFVVSLKKKGVQMKDLLPKVLKVIAVAGCIIGAVVLINKWGDSKRCIVDGCNNYRADNSGYCSSHKPSTKTSTSSGTSSYDKSSGSSSNKTSTNKTSTSKSSTSKSSTNKTSAYKYVKSKTSTSKSSTSTSGSKKKSSIGSNSSTSKKTTTGKTSSSKSSTRKKSSSSKKNPYQSYDDGYDDIYMDDDYDEERYKTDKDYADGVDDAMDEFDGDW